MKVPGDETDPDPLAATSVVIAVRSAPCEVGTRAQVEIGESLAQIPVVAAVVTGVEERTAGVAQRIRQLDAFRGKGCNPGEQALARPIDFLHRQRDRRGEECELHLDTGVRRNRHRLLVGARRVRRAASVLQGVAQVVKSLGSLRLALVNEKQVGEVVERSDVLRLQRDDALVGRVGIGEPLLFALAVGEIEPGVREPRIERKCTAKGGFRVGMTPQHRQGIAEIAVCRRVVGLDADRIADQADGILVPTVLECEQAEIMHRAGVPRLLREKLPITGFRLGQLP